MGTYISQHVIQTRWLAALSVRSVFAFIFGFLLAEVQEDFVVGEEGGLGGFDLEVES